MLAHNTEGHRHMQGPYPSKGVANSFLNRGNEHRIPIDPMKIQKLVYFAHGYYIAISGIPLVDEPFEAWPYGPVLPSLYQEFKSYGNQPIIGLATDLDWEREEFIPTPPPSDDPLAQRCIDYVWSTYGNKSSTELSALSHDGNGPWALTKDGNKFNLRNIDIQNETISNYFKKFLGQ